MNRLSMQAENQTERELTDMLTAKELLGCAQALEPQLVEWRRTLHRHPEVGFDLTQTKALVKKALTEMGYEPKDCGKAGVIALAGGKKPGKTILLRGDMDALPIQEESGVDYASEVPGKMHGCGHDMHTAFFELCAVAVDVMCFCTYFVHDFLNMFCFFFCHGEDCCCFVFFFS